MSKLDTMMFTPQTRFENKVLMVMASILVTQSAVIMKVRFIQLVLSEHYYSKMLTNLKLGTIRFFPLLIKKFFLLY